MKNLVLLFAVLWMSTAFSQSNFQNQPTDPAPSILLDQSTGLADYELFDLQTVRKSLSEVVQVTKGTLFSLNELELQNLRSSAPQSLTLEIPNGHGENLILHLYEVDIFSDGFILATSGNEDLSEVDLGLHYRGTVEGAKESIIAISVFSEMIRGVIVADEANYNLGPIELESTEYICYKSEDLNEDIKSQLNYSCSSIESESDVYTEDELYHSAKGPGDNTDIYLEVDKSIFDIQGSVGNATAYTTSLFNQCAAIYAAESVGQLISQIFVWSTPDPYDGVNANPDVRVAYLQDFQAQFNGFNGDLALLLINANIGGYAAGFSGLCNPNPDLSMCISGQSGTVINTFPTYSYNTYIFAHELGHLFGSRHTHACVWNGNNTAIDGCFTTEGGCPLPPLPAFGSATVMSYCQAQLAGGYIPGAPFGLQPGNVIRSSVANAACIGCTNPMIYIPTTPSGTSPAVYLCPGDPIPPGYFLANQGCAQAIVDFDPFCLNTGWDGVCQGYYNSCIGVSCTAGTIIYIPDVVSGGPAIIGCGLVPAGYSPAANEACAQEVIDNDPFCIDTNWDQVCQDAYDDCADCSAFSTAPVDLTKSFDPVNGIQDRVQVKWFKASPSVRYTDGDAAMCDIKFWPKRNLIPGTTTPTGPVIVASSADTTNITDAKKTYGDNSPREIFKWPVKFRANGVNNNKRADPNIRYEWKVRCECGHDGFSPESPWSVVKTFNTPDFDPATGIYTPPPGVFGENELKSLTPSEIALHPNPANGSISIWNADGLPESFDWYIMDLTGRVVFDGNVRGNKGDYLQIDLNDVAQGSYQIMMVGTQFSASASFLVRR